ncbi:MAG: hypothetical protein J5I92_15315 [Thiogranum sp.]|nr:hypothetical protein [Thiogranum sp.]
MNIVLCLILLILSSGSVAAEIFLGNSPWEARVTDENPAVIHISGTIERGDLNKIKQYAYKLLKNDHEIQFSLDSSGGDFFEAIKIGEFIKELNARTNVFGIYSRDFDDEPTKCYSACFIIFVSGSIRSLRDNKWYDATGNRLLKEFPSLGIHRPYVKQEEYAELAASDARDVYANIETLTRKYLKTVSIPQSTIDEMFTVTSRQIRFISQSEFRDKIGYTQPFFEEWLYSKCGELDDDEVNDLADYVIESYSTDNEKTISPGFKKGYVNYLHEKLSKTESCKDNAVLDHQKAILLK